MPYDNHSKALQSRHNDGDNNDLTTGMLSSAGVIIIIFLVISFSTYKRKPKQKEKKLHTKKKKKKKKKLWRIQDDNFKPTTIAIKDTHVPVSKNHPSINHDSNSEYIIHVK